MRRLLGESPVTDVVVDALVGAAQESAHGGRRVAGGVRDLVAAKARRAQQGDFAHSRRQLAQGPDGLVGVALVAERVPGVARGARFRCDRANGVEDGKFAIAGFAVQHPSFSLGDTEQPAAPVAIAVGLVHKELRPRERARVLDVLPRGAHGVVEIAYELIVEALLKRLASSPRGSGLRSCFIADGQAASERAAARMCTSGQQGRQT